MSNHLVMTLMGRDRPGLVESVASVVANHGGNWLESRMCHLGGQFAGVLRVSVEEKNLRALITALESLTAKGLTLIHKAESEEETPVARSLVTMDVLGQDRPGIVSRITQVLVGLGVNVEELQTELTTAPMSAECLFKARGILKLPSSVNPETLRAQLETMAADLMVDFQLYQEL